jgi:hypothetical protein
MSIIERDLTIETNIIFTKMLNCGVEHRDIQPSNVL